MAYVSHTVSFFAKHASLRRTANGGRATFAGTYVNAIVSDATIITEKNRITAWNARADKRRWTTEEQSRGEGDVRRRAGFSRRGRANENAF